MRVTIFAHEGTAKADVLGTSKTRFIVLRVDEADIFFKGYDQENVDAIRLVIEQLTAATNELQNQIFEELCQPEKIEMTREDEDAYMAGLEPAHKLTTHERHQGQADNGQDTWDEHDEKV